MILNEINGLMDQIETKKEIEKSVLNGEQVSVQPNQYNKKTKKGSDESKETMFNEKRKAKIESIQFGIRVQDYIEQILPVELINTKKKNIYNALLNESIQNLKKRRFFDNSR